MYTSLSGGAPVYQAHDGYTTFQRIIGSLAMIVAALPAPRWPAVGIPNIPHAEANRNQALARNTVARAIQSTTEAATPDLRRFMKGSPAWGENRQDAGDARAREVLASPGASSRRSQIGTTDNP